MLLAQNTVVTVTVLPITFPWSALSDWMTTHPERMIAPTITATADTATRLSLPACRCRRALARFELMLFSFFRGPIRPVRDPWMGAT